MLSVPSIYFSQFLGLSRQCSYVMFKKSVTIPIPNSSTHSSICSRAQLSHSFFRITLCIGIVGIDCTDVPCLLFSVTDPCQNDPCENGKCWTWVDKAYCICFPGYGGYFCNSKYSSLMTKRFHISHYKDKTIPTLSIPPYLFVCVWWGCMFIYVHVCLCVSVCVCVCMPHVSMIFSVRVFYTERFPCI